MSAPAYLSPFRRAAAGAVATALGADVSLLAVSTPPDPKLGDYSVGCFPVAKALRAAPPQLAQKAAAAFQASQSGGLLASAEATGPYVNFRVDRAALHRHLFDATLGPSPRPIGGSPGSGKTVCIDYSSPNIAKQLAYHHIRSTVIGQSLCNLYRALGYTVVGVNHLGDWGTTHGMLLSAHHRWGAPEPLTIETLNALYVRFRAAMKDDPALEDDARSWFKRLEDGDAEARATWRRFKEVSLAEFQEVYDVLGVRFDSVKGESEYEHLMPGVIKMLEDKGLTSISEGALVVNLDEQKMPPLLLKKADGATLYATRDLAAAIYRHDTYDFERSLYVVDKGQSLHFTQVFAVLLKSGHEWATRCRHVPFGLVRLGGKKASTRGGSGGNVVLLKEVLAEAESRIAEKLKETNPDLPAELVPGVTRDVGVGAVVFANLSSQREKDVDFDWDDVLSFSGDAGPYLQYAHARTAGILRKGGVTGGTLAAPGEADLALLKLDEEWALARLLSELGDEAQRAGETQEPHLVARYLLDVAAAFSRWYTLGNRDESLRVLCADPATQRARLALTAATGEVLRAGLHILGMAAPDVM
jgi:arginyl-tRNA synthetase